MRDLNDCFGAVSAEVSGWDAVADYAEAFHRAERCLTRAYSDDSFLNVDYWKESVEFWRVRLDSLLAG